MAHPPNTPGMCNMVAWHPNANKENKHFIHSTQGIALKAALGHTYLHPAMDSLKNVLVPPVGFVLSKPPPKNVAHGNGNGASFSPYEPTIGFGHGKGDYIVKIYACYLTSRPNVRNSLIMLTVILRNVYISDCNFYPISCQEPRDLGKKSELGNVVKARRTMYLHNVPGMWILIFYVDGHRLPNCIDSSKNDYVFNKTNFVYLNSFKDLNIGISDTLTLLVADVNLNTIKTHKYFDSVFKNRLVKNLFDTH